MVAPVYANFVPPAIDAGNLNEINTVIYDLLGDGTNPPINDSDIRTNIGLGTMATQNATAVAITGGTADGVAITGGTVSGLATDLAIADGGTGASTAAAARTNLVVSQTGPSFSASRITSIQTIPNSLATEVVFNGETWDTDSAFNTVNGRFTPLVAGKYQINCTLALQSDAADISTMLVYIAKNGLEYKRGEVRNTPASFPTSGSVTVSGLVDLNGTTDYVSIFAYITRSGGPSYVQFAATSPSWVDGYFVRT